MAESGEGWSGGRCWVAWGGRAGWGGPRLPDFLAYLGLHDAPRPSHDVPLSAARRANTGCHCHGNVNKQLQFSSTHLRVLVIFPQSHPCARLLFTHITDFRELLLERAVARP